MTMILVAWAIVLTIILFGDKGLAALQSGRAKATNALESRKQKKITDKEETSSMIEDGRLSSARQRAHDIRKAEIDAEMHLQGNGFTLTDCGNRECRECFPQPETPLYDAAIDEYKKRPKALSTTHAGAGAKAGRSKSDYYRLKQDTENLKKDLERIREDYTIVSGAGERIASTMYDYIIVNHQSYPRPSEVPDYADVEIRNYWDENFLVWTWHGNYQGRTVEMYYKQPM